MWEPGAPESGRALPSFLLAKGSTTSPMDIPAMEASLFLGSALSWGQFVPGAILTLR